jgi:hypothetical protein
MGHDRERVRKSNLIFVKVQVLTYGDITGLLQTRVRRWKLYRPIS